LSFKALILFVVLSVVSSASLQAQMPFNAPKYESIHRYEYELHRNLPKMPSFFDPSGKGIKHLFVKKSAVNAPSKAIFGYLPYWEYTEARNYLQYDVLTHLAVFDFGANETGSISNPSYWPWTDVINAAHDHGVRVIMTLVNFNADQIHTILTDTTVKKTLFANINKLLGQYVLDGVNIDFEGLYADDRGSLLNGFMADLSASVKQRFPAAEISFAGPAVNWGGWDLLGLSESCDYIFIMGYAFSGGWSANAGPTAPLTGGSYNVTNTVTVQYAEVVRSHPEKLILGVPYYGCRWKTKDGKIRSEAIDFIDNPFFTQSKKEAENYGDFWDSYSQTPWYKYQIGTQWYQVWYDNAASLAKKYDLADSKHLKGVGMWALGYDDGRSELWNLLRQRYLPESEPPAEVPKSIVVLPSTDSTSLHVRFEPVYGVNGYEIYLSTDGINFTLARQTNLTSLTIDRLQANQLYYLLIRSFNDRGYSAYSSLLAATATKRKPALLVDGFERSNGGTNTYRYLKYHATSFAANGFAVASATNDALINNLCVADSFRIADWMLGNEGSNDFTFNNKEKDIVRRFLEQGGRLLVSGSEVGWDLVAKGSPDDRDFFRNYLKAVYLADAPLNRPGVYYRVQPLTGTIFDGLSTFNFDNGTHGTYDVKWPDAILPADDAVLGLQFAGLSTVNGGCGIYYRGTFPESQQEGRLVFLSFPLETVYSTSARNALVGKILDFLNTPAAIDRDTNPQPVTFKMWPNFPNPFNASTRIRFRLPESASVTLQIFDVRGRQIFSKQMNFPSGVHAIVWRGADQSGQPVASGMYFYRLLANHAGQNWLAQGRMVLMK